MNDLISRQAAIDALRVAYWNDNIQSAKDDPCIVDAMTDWAIRQVKALPSAQPEPNTGRWVTNLENHTYECSECGNGIITNKEYLKKHKFCFCCGAKILKDGEGK